MSKPSIPAILGATPDGAPFAVNVDELVGAHLAVIANSGAGKSRSVRKLLEATHGRIQHVVLDDEGEFYTLRERFPYVIVGGANGDCPLSIASAGPLALALLENGLSAIVQTGTLDAEDGQAFVAAFLEALRTAPQALWHPVLVVLDEAQRFAPSGEVVASSRAVSEFAASARKRGYTLVVATGRFTMLSTKVRAHCVNWLVGRAGLDADSRAAAQALGFRLSSSEAQGFKSLDRGAFWAFGSALAPSPTLVQFGDVTTTHLRRGQAPVPTPPAPRKLAKILAALTAAAVPPAEALANEGDRPAAGTNSGPAASARSPTAAEIAAAERRGFDCGLEEGLRRGGGFLVALARDAGAALEQVIGLMQGHADRAATGGWVLAQPAPAATDGASATSPRSAVAVSDPSGQTAAEVILSPVRRRILDALAWAEAAGQPEPTRAFVAVLVRVSHTSGGFRNNLGALHTAGLVRYPRKGAVALSASGQALATPPAAAPDHGAVMRRVCDGISPARRRLLAVVVAAHPAWISREDMAALVGTAPTSGGFRNNLGRLSSLGLVTYPAPGQVRAADLLFPDRRISA